MSEPTILQFVILAIAIGVLMLVVQRMYIVLRMEPYWLDLERCSLLGLMKARAHELGIDPDNLDAMWAEAAKAAGPDASPTTIYLLLTEKWAQDRAAHGAAASEGRAK
jgi:hypothetical protein